MSDLFFECRWINVEGGSMYQILSQDEVLDFVTKLVALGRRVLFVERI